MRGILVKCCVTVGLLQTILCVGQAVNADSISPPIGGGKIGLECSARGIDNEMMHLLDVMPLFELAEPTVIQPIDMSADYPGMTLKSYGVKLPKQLYTADTNAQGQPFKLKANLVYGFAQHVHGIGVLPNHTLLVVERPQVMKYRKSRIWVDINHNLDLTDDPIQFYTPSSVAFSLGVVPESGSVIKLDNNEWGVALQLGFFLGGELRSYQKLYSDAVDLVKADRKFIGVSNSFRQRRMTVIYGSNVYQNDTLFWALKDVNVNGTYNDIGVDMIMVSNDHGLFNTANAWKLVKGKTILDWLGQGWRAQVWNKLPGLGSAEWGLTLEPINNNQVKNARSLLIGNKLPKFRFCVIEGAYKVGKIKDAFFTGVGRGECFRFFFGIDFGQRGEAYEQSEDKQDGSYYDVGYNNATNQFVECCIFR